MDLDPKQTSHLISFRGSLIEGSKRKTLNEAGGKQPKENHPGGLIGEWREKGTELEQNEEKIV